MNKEGVGRAGRGRNRSRKDERNWYNNEISRNELSIRLQIESNTLLLAKTWAQTHSILAIEENRLERMQKIRSVIEYSMRNAAIWAWLFHTLQPTKSKTIARPKEKEVIKGSLSMNKRSDYYHQHTPMKFQFYSRIDALWMAK